MSKKFLYLLGVLALLLAPAGCIFSPDDDVPQDDVTIEPLPFPDSPDQLMENFQTIYENMDINAYYDLLHPNYVTLLQQTTQDDFPEVGAFLDVNEEFGIHKRMFSGASGRNAAGETTSPISSITIQPPHQVGGWTRTDDYREYFGTEPYVEKSLYEVEFDFHRAGDKTLQVRGKIVFYITNRDSVHLGATKKYYQMMGQFDQTNDE